MSYRLGLVEGMVIDDAGQLELTAPMLRTWSTSFPVPRSQGVPAIVELAGKAQTATWITSWQGQGVDRVKMIETLQVEQHRVGTAMQKALDELRPRSTLPIASINSLDGRSGSDGRAG